MALGEVAAPAGEQREPLLQPGEELLLGEELHPRRRKLERERESIESLADRVDLSARLVARLHLPRPRGEQLDGGVGRQRRHWVLLLGGHPEPLPARRDHPATRRAGEQLGDRASCLDHLLEVVKHEQQGSPAQIHRQIRDVAERRRDRRRYQPRLADHGERNPPHAVRIAVGEARRERQPEPGLARPTGSGQGDQPARISERHQLGKFALAADEGCRLHGQMDMARRSPVRRGAGTGGRGRLAWVGLEQRPVLSEDRFVQLPKLDRRLNPQFVDQRRPCGTVGGQRFRLASGPVQSQHQPAPQTLAIRVVAHETLELAQHLRLPAQKDFDRDPLLQHGGAKLAEPRDLPLRESVVLKVGQDVAAPQLDCAAQRGECLIWSSRRQ